MKVEAQLLTASPRRDVRHSTNGEWLRIAVGDQ
jgi:hypothetical protein